MAKVWILFWFNDYTRFFGVVMGGHLVFTLPAFYLFFGVEYIKDFCLLSYCFVFLFALIDNDYSKLRKYGYDEYGKKISGNSN